MNNEEKQLVLQDICARLLYGLRVRIYNHWTDSFEDETLSIDNIGEILQHFPIEDIKPYLRSMSSMTTEEEYEYHQYKNIDYLEICNQEHHEIIKTTVLVFSNAIDWLIKHHFDFRGLIPMGLALEASADMYEF